MSKIESNLNIYLKVYNGLEKDWAEQLEAMDPEDYLYTSRASTLYELRLKIKVLNDVKKL
jgi:hypothetical protein